MEAQVEGVNLPGTKKVPSDHPTIKEIDLINDTKLPSGFSISNPVRVAKHKFASPLDINLIST